MDIRALHDTPQIREGLRDLLVEVVAHGGLVHFLHPLQAVEADAFWNDALAGAARGERLVLGAFDDALLVGTVTLVLASPPNAPHRGEIAKMMTRVSHRRRGVATALLRAAEREAVTRGKMLLMLDTAVEGGSAALYEAEDYQLCGIVPDHALRPHGGLCGTAIYWKSISI